MKLSSLIFISVLVLSAANSAAENTPQPQSSKSAQNEKAAQSESTRIGTQQHDGTQIGYGHEQIDARVTEPISVVRDNLFFGFTIGFNGLLVLLSYLLWQTSKRQAEIMAKAEETSRRSLEVTALALNVERPYLLIDSIRIREVPSLGIPSLLTGEPDQRPFLQIAFEIRNFGKGVGIIKSVDVRLYVGPGFIPTASVFERL